MWHHWNERSHPFLYDDTNTPPLILRGAMGNEWPVEAPLTATCPWGRFRYGIAKNFRRNSCGDSPGVDCNCGIYAVKYTSRLRPFTHNNVVGIVQLWGKVIEAEFGYRAQHGQIRAVINAPEIVATTYRIPNLSSIEYARREYFPVQENKEVV
jgi:hypothetical protein